MRTRALAIAVLLALGPAAPGHAAPQTTGGTGCHLAAAPDPTAQPVTYVTVLQGGPLVLTNAATGMPARGTLVCRVQVDQPTHTGATAGITTAHSIGVFSVAGRTSFIAAPGSRIYACMEFVDDSDGQTYYFDPDRGIWTSSPDGPCGLAGVVLGVVLHIVGCQVPDVPCTVDPVVRP